MLPSLGRPSDRRGNGSLGRWRRVQDKQVGALGLGHLGARVEGSEVVDTHDAVGQAQLRFYFFFSFRCVSQKGISETYKQVKIFDRLKLLDRLA